MTSFSSVDIMGYGGVSASAPQSPGAGFGAVPVGAPTPQYAPSGTGNTPNGGGDSAVTISWVGIVFALVIIRVLAEMGAVVN